MGEAWGERGEERATVSDAPHRGEANGPREGRARPRNARRHRAGREKVARRLGRKWAKFGRFRLGFPFLFFYFFSFILISLKYNEIYF